MTREDLPMKPARRTAPLTALCASLAIASSGIWIATGAAGAAAGVVTTSAVIKSIFE
jgi:hypothetical protein